MSKQNRSLIGSGGGNRTPDTADYDSAISTYFLANFCDFLIIMLPMCY